MDSFPIHKNEQSMFVTQFLCRSIEEQIKNWCTFPPVYVNKLLSHWQGSRVQVQYGGLQGTNKKTGMSANNNKKQVSWTNNSKLVQAWHSDRFKGEHWSLSGLFVAFSLCPLLVIAYQLLRDTDLKISHFQRSLSVASPRFMWVS